MKKMYVTPKMKVFNCAEEDICTFSADALMDNEFLNSSQWWKETSNF